MQYAVAILIAGAIGFGVMAIVRAVGRYNETYRQVRFRLGFSPVQSLDDATMERVGSLIPHGRAKIRLTKLYMRDCGSYRLYDCQAWTGSQSNERRQAMIMVMPSLNLPSIRMVPTIGGKGTLGKLVRSAMQVAFKQGGFQEVDMSGSPSFTENYALLAKDPSTVRLKLKSQVLDEIAAIPHHLLLACEEDTIIFSVLRMKRTHRGFRFEEAETERLTQSVEIASRLSSAFSAH